MKFWFLLSSALFSLVAGAIPVSEYIWMDYGKIDVRPENDKYYRATLPCRTRIGMCSYEYYLLPLGWAVYPNGDIRIPAENISSPISFSIQLTASQPTGQKLEISIVAEMINGKMNIHDRGVYFQSYDFKYSSSNNIRASGTNQKKLKILPIPEQKTQTQTKTNGSLNLQQLRQILIKGNQSELSVFISNLIVADRGCNRKIKQLEQVIKQLQIQIGKNQGQIQVTKSFIYSLQIELNKLKKLKISLQNAGGNSNKKIDIQLQVRQLQAKIQSQNLKQIRYEQFASSYMFAIQRMSVAAARYNTSNSALQIQQVSFAEEQKQIQLIESAIKQLILRKYQLQRQISEKILKISVSNIRQVPENLNALSQKYRQYSQLAITAKIQAQNAKLTLSTIRSRSQLSAQSFKAVEDTITQLELKILQKNSKVANGTEIAVVVDTNVLLQKNVNKLTEQIQELKKTCSVSN